MMPNRVFSTQNHKWGLFTIFKTHLMRSSKSFKISKSTQNDAKTCFWYSEPGIRIFNIFKSHLKRSIEVLTFLNRLRMMPNPVFSTQNPK